MEGGGAPSGARLRLDGTRCDGDSDVIDLLGMTGLPGPGRGAMKNVHEG
jgi:hypothetical protein